MSTLDKKYYHNIDLDSNELKAGRIYNVTDSTRTTLKTYFLANTPANFKGYIVYDTTALSLFIWNGTDWTTSSGGGGGTITALTGDVTASGSGSVVATIANGAVTLPKMANLATYSIIGNNTGTSVTPKALTGTEVAAMLPMFSNTAQGLVPAATSGLSPYLFLAADRTWQKIGTAAIANQPDKTILANTSASSGAVTAVAISSITTDLLDVVGDSGSGGTKGLVPGPAAGDATAGKFLSASGTWTKPIVSYIHTQETSNTIWNISHNLNIYPNVTVINSTGASIVGDITYTSTTSLTLTFSAPVTGKAYLS